MQIMAGAEPSSDAFFHVGYLSVGPRTFTMSGIDNPEWAQLLTQGTLLDVGEALRLEESAAATVQAPGAEPLSQASTGAFIGAFLACLAMVYFGQRLKTVRGRLGAWACAVLLLALAMAFLFPLFIPDPYAVPPADDPPPWRAVAVRKYADPHKATQVLMHGIVADALANAGNPVENLGQIRNEVGLPTKEPTEGMRYALQTYGLDGWGRPFRLEGKNLELLSDWLRRYRRHQRVQSFYYREPWEASVPYYVLTSAGPDGAFDTGDDLRRSVPTCVEYDWESVGRAPYLCRYGDGHVLLFHRWRGVCFRYADEEWARRITGNGLYDVLPLKGERDPYITWPRDPAKPDKTYPTFEEVAAGLRDRYEALSAESSAAPLVLLVPGEKASSRG